MSMMTVEKNSENSTLRRLRRFFEKNLTHSPRKLKQKMSSGVHDILGGDIAKGNLLDKL